VMHPGLSAGNEPLCQYHSYGTLIMAPLMSILTAILWGMGGWPVVLPGEYRLRLFRPPRALLTSLP
jgi:hypothetical protein